MTSKRAQKKPDFTLLTIRVSRDSGKTWEPKREVRSSEKLAPLPIGAWPMCECPRCLK
ncbi:hypothetical protein GCM10010329_50570 [Streptomyces spiroverticillatus]|uniref:Exo-alpha-sialidase n=1 Tax=Streptomyces finlayi TaxID=67296 RepID=A0A919CC64_9ACTN|nr:hypothetical protein GCM10010329_50570 [Streptomyces spiroverticillatus]GHD03552.1 hypothetical protein GCM10010334_51520 [Streptomyces finlayi]